jgi:hypothetical protein
VAHIARPSAFGPVYRRLVGSLGIVVVGGWGAFLLDGHESSTSAALVIVGVGVLAGGIAGWRLAILVAFEAVALVALGLHLPILVIVAAAARRGSLRRS